MYYFPQCRRSKIKPYNTRADTIADGGFREHVGEDFVFGKGKKESENSLDAAAPCVHRNTTTHFGRRDKKKKPNNNEHAQKRDGTRRAEGGLRSRGISRTQQLPTTPVGG